MERQLEPNDNEHDFASGGLNNGKVKLAGGCDKIDFSEVGPDFDDSELKQ